MRRALAASLMMAVSGCDVKMLPDGGVERTVRIRPVDAVLTANGLAYDPQRGTGVTWWSDTGQVSPATIDPDGASIFPVPPGPALFEYAPKRFVYSTQANLEPCGTFIRGATASSSAGVELDVTLSQPAGPQDTLEVASSLLRPAWPGRAMLRPDAGATALRQRIDWGGHAVLSGNTTVVHRAAAPQVLGFTRTTTVGLLDAGVIDQLADTTVAVQGTFEPVAAGPEVSLVWSDESLDGLTPYGGDGGVFGVTFSARRDGVNIAEVSGAGRRRSDRPTAIALPALTPQAFRVEGSYLLDLGTLRPLLFAWQGPWTGAPEMKLLYGPPRDVRIAADGASVSWQPPALAPGAYVVVLVSPAANGGYQELATIVTEQTTVPLPFSMRGAGMFAQVSAVSGAGISDATCVFQFDQLETWAWVTSASPEWNP